jgi:hypothetical protein
MTGFLLRLVEYKHIVMTMSLLSQAANAVGSMMQARMNRAPPRGGHACFSDPLFIRVGSLFKGAAERRFAVGALIFAPTAAIVISTVIHFRSA